MDLFLQFAALWMLILLVVVLSMVARGPDTLTRILALDTLGLVIVGILSLVSHRLASALYLDAALALSLLAFLGTLAATRFYHEGKVF